MSNPHEPSNRKRIFEIADARTLLGDHINTVHSRGEALGLIDQVVTSRKATIRAIEELQAHEDQLNAAAAAAKTIGLLELAKKLEYHAESLMGIWMALDTSIQTD